MVELFKREIFVSFGTLNRARLESKDETEAITLASSVPYANLTCKISNGKCGVINEPTEVKVTIFKDPFQLLLDDGGIRSSVISLKFQHFVLVKRSAIKQFSRS